MDTLARPLIDELIAWIDREIERAGKETTGESEPRPSDGNREPEQRERLRVPASIPA